MFHHNFHHRIIPQSEVNDEPSTFTPNDDLTLQEILARSRRERQATTPPGDDMFMSSRGPLDIDEDYSYLAQDMDIVDAFEMRARLDEMAAVTAERTKRQNFSEQRSKETTKKPADEESTSPNEEK